MPILSPFISSRSDNISLYQLAGSTGSEGSLDGSSLTLNSTTSAQTIQQKFNNDIFVFTQTPDPGVERIIYTINQVSGDVSFGVNVTAPNQLTNRLNYAETFFINFPVAGPTAYPTNAGAGNVPLPAYSVTATGMYVIQCLASFNVSPEEVVVGAADFIVCGVGNFAPAIPVVYPTTLKPWSMAAAGQDYSIDNTFTALLTAGTFVSPFYYVYNGSGALNLGATSGGISVKILPLC
jgi:hypothetical protein